MNPTWLRAVLASLPVLGLVLEAESGLIYGGLGVSVPLAATLIFFTLRAALPKILHRLSFFLLVLVLGIIAGEVFLRETPSGASLLLVSLMILIPPELFRPGKHWLPMFRKILLGGLYFGILVAGHGSLSEFLGLGWGWELFQLPVGSYLLMGLALVFLQK